MTLKGYVEVSLLDLIDKLGEDHVKEILSDFSCPLNKDVEYFLKNRAIEFAKQSITQTHTVFIQFQGKPRLVGYYSLTQKSISVKDEGLSKTLRRRIGKFGTRDVNNKRYILPAPLIAQLGKNFTDGLNTQISGDELLKMALDQLRFIQQLIGGRVVYLECEDKPKLIDFYSRNGFVKFGERTRDSEDEGRIEGQYLVQMLKVLK